MLRKTTYSILFISHALPLVFLLTALCMQQWIRWEKIEELEHAKLIQVKVSHSSITWIKEGKELLIDGNLFDVKSIEEKNDQVILTGLYDHEETAIINAINGQTATGQDAGQLRTTFIYTLLMGLSTPIEQLNTVTYLPSFLFLHPSNTLLYQHPFQDPLSPPPQC